jgi:hypothetical protein
VNDRLVQAPLNKAFLDAAYSLQADVSTGDTPNMKTKMARNMALTVGLVGLFGASPASAVVVDFESAGPFPTFYTVLTTQGFSFDPVGNSQVVTLFDGQACAVNCAGNGTATLAAGGLNQLPQTDQPLTMSSATGQPFYLNGFDYAEFTATAPNNANSLSLIGHLVGGGFVFQSFAVDGLTDGPGGANDFQTAVLSPVWATAKLASLDFQGFNFVAPTTPRGFQLDNIDVTPVPEPGTLMLIGSGLAGLALRRRRS